VIDGTGHENGNWRNKGKDKMLDNICQCSLLSGISARSRFEIELRRLPYSALQGLREEKYNIHQQHQLHGDADIKQGIGP
jgi:hypothetical protein